MRALAVVIVVVAALYVAQQLLAGSDARWMDCAEREYCE